ncbi:MAG: hypothetical protein H6678_11530 [Candidatus Delongbacteria bacterium]|nr:hypothetical protein [Candidatus Delongbacteria bacterium]
MTVSKTSVLGALLALAISAGASGAPDMRVEAGDLLLSWTVSGMEITPLTLHGQEWLQVNAGSQVNPIGIEGAPSVPAWHEWIRLTDLGGLQADIVSQSWSELEGTVVPEQEREFGPGDLPLAWSQDTQCYATPGWYPEHIVELGAPVLLRNNRLAQLTVHPVQTDPVLNRTRVLDELTVRVTFTDLDPRNPRLVQLPVDTSVLNQVLASTVIARPGEESLRDIFDIRTLPGTYRVYARTNAVANNAVLQNLLNWKREKGHVVNVVTAADMGGSWNSSTIRNDISNAYFNSSTPPDYVLLIGDPSATSSSDYYLPCGDTSSDGTQDHYYAMIEGNDNLGDVAVGRFSVNNVSQLQAVANKVLVYETAPQTADAGMEWLDRAALAVGYDALSMRQLSQSIIDDMISDGMDPAGIATRYGGTSDSQGSWVSGQFGSGIGLYNYRGWIGMNGVSASFVDNNSNFLNAYRTPVAAVFTCSTGDFNGGYSTTEALLVKGSVAEPRGAVASMGLATSLTHTAYNNVLVGGFWSAVLDHGLDQIGPAMFFGKQTLVMNMPNGDASADAFSRRANLMGDPGMDIWVGIPEILSVQLAAGGTTIPLGSGVQDFLVLSNGTPAEGIAVCLYQSGNVFQRGTTDASGHVLLDASGASAGALKLTASRSRHLPDRQTLTVVSQNNFAGVTTLGVTGDGLAAPGESVSFLPTVSNPGATAIAGLSCTLSMDPAYGTVNDNSSAWPTIAAGGTAGASNALQVTLAGDLADGTQVPLTFQFNSTTLTSWTETEFLTVNAPRLEASSLTFSPGGTLLQPGTTASLSLTLGNLGTLDASSLNLSLASAGDPFVSVTSGVFNGFSANAGGSGVATFQLSADLHSLRGHQASLPLTWSGGGLSGQTMVSVTVGSSGSASPTGPDAWGYRAIENTDFHSLAPEYQWIEIATPAGGNGTFINLGDTGNELDAAQLVTLPFAFTYYGQSYTQMAVCSNGFVTFDENGENQTDFRNHFFPSGLGPDAMIGVNWDDHKSSGTNGVYVQYIPAQHAYVVEWYQMTHNPSGGTNTFQLVMYDPAFHATPTGDAPFKMQYAVWNNIQSGNSDFDYCSVGIKDQTSSVGLNLTNFNIEAATIESFEAGRAILFTTEVGAFDDSDTQAPVLLVSSPAVVEPGVSPVIHATITDQSGVLSATLYYSTNGVNFTPVAMNPNGNLWDAAIPAYSLGTMVWYYVYAVDSSDNGNSTTSSTYSYTVVEGNPPSGPDAYGYRIYDIDDAGESHDFAWVDISGIGTLLTLGDDAASVITLPFPIVYYGNSFTQMSICSNGFVNLGGSTYTAYSNTGLASNGGTSDMICAFWDDLNPNNGGNVRYYDDVENDRLVVSWIGVPHFSGGGPESFQIVFYNHESYPTVTGDTPFHLQYQVVDTPSGCTVGMQNSGRNDGIQYLYNGGYETNAEVLVNGQSLWVTTGTAFVPPPVPEPVTDLHIQYSLPWLTLSWTATNGDSYAVFQDDNPYGTFSDAVGTTTQTSIQVLIGLHKYFRVTTVINDPARQVMPEHAPIRVLRTESTSK